MTQIILRPLGTDEGHRTPDVRLAYKSGRGRDAPITTAYDPKRNPRSLAELLDPVMGGVSGSFSNEIPRFPHIYQDSVEISPEGTKRA